VEAASRHLEQQLVSTRRLVKETLSVRKFRRSLSTVAGLRSSQLAKTDSVLTNFIEYCDQPEQRPV